MNVIEHLSQDEEGMRKFCLNCRLGKNCRAEWNPFYNYGCVRESDIKNIEEAADEFERVVKEAVA